ncbi:NAD(P)H-hydrate dehydratase [Cyanobacterium aponinum AL20118]|uniref:Bifunctional NAD(P)H-hydrate repair enzyme n=1 Tax=Cyanobacterium aponinum AL20115 TaxID=3090662 RepID=A0AAF1C2C3_9CHRO|nr:NAD(P)H-hydrate dehydratase [Cyanobacterium aponinum]WPF89542.1 NAD(P)H-hydrate dehydratase [Cyanobacterium aponinum AL20115]
MIKTSITVTAKQMQEIEERIFSEGMPVASLMEKAAVFASQKITQLYPLNLYQKVGLIIGCGHNGGDGLVIARELFLQGFQVSLYIPLREKSKDLTKQHLQYAEFLGIASVEFIEDLSTCDFIVDCLFGFGLTRNIEGKLREDIIWLNQQSIPVVSIDIPSGIHTDTGNVLGIAVKAVYTLCLGLWKVGLFLSSAVEYTGSLHLIDIGIPESLLMGEGIRNDDDEREERNPPLYPPNSEERKREKNQTENVNYSFHCQYVSETNPHIITKEDVKNCLPLPRHVNTHKYKQGNLLLICGSNQYAGAALLAGYGAKCGGSGMITFAVPHGLKKTLISHFPWALVIGLPVKEEGTIISLRNLDLNKYDAIAFGMGIGREVSAYQEQTLAPILNSEVPLIIDADGLNILAEGRYWQTIKQRKSPTILTPHIGEFKRLFPQLNLSENSLEVLKMASKMTNTTILLKGAKTLVSEKGINNWIVNLGTPALARGGSGDVLSGFLGAVIAQTNLNIFPVAKVVATCGWLHQQGGILAAQNHTEMGVDGVTLSEYINKAVVKTLGD